jgi:hypothetical protein
MRSVAMPSLSRQTESFCFLAAARGSRASPMAMPFFGPDDKQGTIPHFISDASVADLRSSSQGESSGF